MSDVPALAEIVCDGDTGLLFRAGDAASLTECVDSLVSDPLLGAPHSGSALRTWVATHRRWEQTAGRYRGIYARLGAA